MKRKTIQRALTLRAVQTMQSHPTADEVYEAVSAEHPNISKGTVYRKMEKSVRWKYRAVPTVSTIAAMHIIMYGV